jgi:phosphoglycerol transferase MdoB-like AlkP superfamily enzyme
VVASYLHQLLLLIKRLSVIYFLYFITRLLFFLVNQYSFANVSFFDFLSDCFYALRFDSFSIVVSNSLFILLSILPVNLFSNKIYHSLLKWLFVICNSVFLMANCIDIAYFRFIKKRSTADLFKQLGGQTDMSRLIPQFIHDFWWLFLFYAILVFLVIFLYKRIKTPPAGLYSLSRPKQWLFIGLLFILAGGLAFLAVRGGTQRVPITIGNAGSVTNADEVPIVLNTPFTLIKSMDETPQEEYSFYADSALKKIYNPLHYYKDSVFKKQNVVVLILESFAKGYTKLGRTKSMTPFFDSLMDKSMLFTNGFANGTKSIEGIPAILSSLPSYMQNPFINSIYANNHQTSFASILGQEGYETAFFHGGINGTMNFDTWAKQAGYQHYYGKDEYNNDSDFDNYWGIWDEPFLQYSIQKMSAFKQPFHSAIFTLSSHHPYFVPEKYKNKFPKNDLENSESIGYADYSLRQFFTNAKKTDWYKNTLFVLVADHCSLAVIDFYTNQVGYLLVPILIFKPDNSLVGIKEHAFSQVDILPSALQLLGYNKPFFAFGETFTRPLNHQIYYYANGTFYQYGDSMVAIIQKNEIGAVFNYRRDSLLKKDLLNVYPDIQSGMLNRYRAFIQTYNHTLNTNSGSLK